MAKQKGKTRALARRVVGRARASPRRARPVAQEGAQKAEALLTPAAGVSAAAASALGSALGARIVASGWLSPKQTGAALVVVGGATSYAGYQQESPILFGAGVGTGLSGVSLLTTNTILERKEQQQERQQRRNAVLLMPHEDYREFEEGKQDEDELLQ